MSWFGREIHKTRHVGTLPVGRMNNAKKHFHLGNEIIRAIGIRESDIEECEVITTSIKQINKQGDFLRVTISAGVDDLQGAFHKRFTNTCKKLQQNQTSVEFFINKNHIYGLREK